MSQQEIIEYIQLGEYNKALDKLYKNFSAFKNSFRKAGGNKTDAEDLFQDALLVLIEKVSEPNFKLTCNINSFLFGICRNLSLSHFRKKGQEVTLQLEVEINCSIEEIEEYVQEEHKYVALDKALESIGKKCMDILGLFYNQNLSMSEIARRLGFKNETSAKTQKYKCIEKARKLSESLFIELQTRQS